MRVEAADFTQCATHGSFSRRWQETVYNMFHFTTLYVLPLLVMSCCYSRILLHIHLQHLRDRGTCTTACTLGVPSMAHVVMHLCTCRWSTPKKYIKNKAKDRSSTKDQSIASTLESKQG